MWFESKKEEDLFVVSCQWCVVFFALGDFVLCLVYGGVQHILRCVFYLACLRLVSCVYIVATFFGLSILDRPFGFSNVYVEYQIHMNMLRIA